jgi:hypothetical protein
MTTPSETNVVYFTGADTTSVFSYTYQIFDEDDLRVVVKKTSTGVETLLVIATDYTVSGVGDGDGGSITLVDADQVWLTGANLATGYTMSIRRAPEIIQETDIRNEGQGYKGVLENQFDKCVHIDQSQQSEINRTLKIPETENPSSYDLAIPAADLRAGKYLGFDDDGNLTATAALGESDVAVSGFWETVLDDSTAAASLTTLGVTAPAQTILDDASVSAIRTTLEIDGTSGVIAGGDLASTAVAQVFQARITVATGDPFAQAAATATTLYLAPATGDKLALYYSSRWNLRTLTQISIAVPAVADQMYDLFVYDNAGTLTLEATAWTNDTTRATALTTQNGVYVKTGATNKRYAGSFRTKTSGQASDDPRWRHVWNYYNRMTKPAYFAATVGAHAYTTNTWRQRAADTTQQIDFIQGVADEWTHLRAFGTSQNTDANVIRGIGIGQSSTTVPMTVTGFPLVSGGNTSVSAALAYCYHTVNADVLQAGRYYYTLLEKSAATGTTSWPGQDDLSFNASGLTALVRC